MVRTHVIPQFFATAGENIIRAPKIQNFLYRCCTLVHALFSLLLPIYFVIALLTNVTAIVVARLNS